MQRADAREKAAQAQFSGLPPYRLVLSRIVNPFSSPKTTTTAGLEIRSADLHGAHRGSRPPTPVIASGEFLYHTTGAPPNDIPLFTHRAHQHHFILEWRYDSKGRLCSLVLGAFWFLGALLLPFGVGFPTSLTSLTTMMNCVGE